MYLLLHLWGLIKNNKILNHANLSSNEILDSHGQDTDLLHYQRRKEPSRIYHMSASVGVVDFFISSAFLVLGWLLGWDDSTDHVRRG
jgi:hypothetical protein